MNAQKPLYACIVFVFIQILGRVSLRKSKIGFLNPNHSENGFCVSFLNRSIQDFSDHVASKEPKNPLWKWILRYLWRTMIRENFWLTCLVKKHKVPFWILSDWRIQSSIFLKKRTLNQQRVRRCCNFSFVSIWLICLELNLRARILWVLWERYT